ncbi:MAG: hypothetical protein ABMA64_36255 [Myxococcota bacterium]
MRFGGLLALIGCGWSERRFEVDGIDQLCEAAAACAGTYDAATCVDLLRTTDREGCAYDAAAAADCVDGLDGAACETIEPFGVTELALPPACAEVWDCAWLDLSAF